MQVSKYGDLANYMIPVSVFKTFLCVSNGLIPNLYWEVLAVVVLVNKINDLEFGHHNPKSVEDPQNYIKIFKVSGKPVDALNLYVTEPSYYIMVSIQFLFDPVKTSTKRFSMHIMVYMAKGYAIAAAFQESTFIVKYGPFTSTFGSHS